MTKPHLLLPSSNNAMTSETWKPFEINELDEMERVQSLKHRENLIKGMGITDFVNRILHGTPGTVATIPPSFNSHNTKTVSIPNNININGNNLISSNINSNINSDNINSNLNKNDDQQSNDAIGKSLLINSNFNGNKLEIKTKTYNPFENHSLFAEVNFIFEYFFKIIKKPTEFLSFYFGSYFENLIV